MPSRRHDLQISVAPDCSDVERAQCARANSLLLLLVLSGAPPTVSAWHSAQQGLHAAMIAEVHVRVGECMCQSRFGRHQLLWIIATADHTGSDIARPGKQLMQVSIRCTPHGYAENCHQQAGGNVESILGNLMLNERHAQQTLTCTVPLR